MENTLNLSALEPVVARCRNVPGSLITALQQTQALYGYLPPEPLRYVAEQLGVPAARVYGVATFYTQFRFAPVGKYFIELCKGTACHVNGADTIAHTIEEELGVTDGGTTEDGLFSLKCVACLGCCSLSPVMMINGETYGSLTPAKVRDILAQKRKEAESNA